MILVNIFVHSPLFCVLILYLFEIESQKWSAVVQGMHACWGGTYIGVFLPGHLCVGETWCVGGQDSGFCVLPTQPVWQKHFSGTFLCPQFNGFYPRAPGRYWFINVGADRGGLACWLVFQAFWDSSLAVSPVTWWTSLGSQNPSSALHTSSLNLLFLQEARAWVWLDTTFCS